MPPLQDFRNTNNYSDTDFSPTALDVRRQPGKSTDVIKNNNSLEFCHLKSKGKIKIFSDKRNLYDELSRFWDIVIKPRKCINIHFHLIFALKLLLDKFLFYCKIELSAINVMVTVRLKTF